MKKGKEKTHSSRLTMTTQNVKSDISNILSDVSEADHDLDTPLLVIVVLSESYFSDQTESCGSRYCSANETAEVKTRRLTVEGSGETLADIVDE